MADRGATAPADQGAQAHPDAAAKRIGIGQPDLSNVLRGRFHGYSVERLMRMLTAFDQDIDIVLTPPHKTGKPAGSRSSRRHERRAIQFDKAGEKRVVVAARRGMQTPSRHGSPRRSRVTLSPCPTPSPSTSTPTPVR